MKEDYAPAAPTTAPNTSLGIKAGPILIGKKQKGGKQGGQRPPMDTQIIMASYEWDKQPVKGKKLKAIINPMDKTNTVYVSANEEALDETLGKSAEAGDWIHDFVHSTNPKFEGKSKKQRIKMALGAYYAKQNESVDEGTTGATRMQIQKTYDHTFTHAPGWTVAQRTAHVEKHHQVKDVKINSYGDVVSYKHLNEATEAADDNKPEFMKGDFIHAGYGQLGGAGVHGYVSKIAGNRVHFTGSETHVGMEGKPYKKKFIAPLKHVTLLHREDYIVDFEEDIEPILEAARKQKLSASVNDPDQPKFQAARDPRPVAENYADWHDEMEKRGSTESPVEFKIKNAGGRTEAHHKGKRIGAFDHEKRKPIKETMFEAVKRRYLGKTRGTTATGKPAHQVVVDPVLKMDDAAANRKQAMPAPDRGI